MTSLEIGRLLRAGTSGFVAGCRSDQIDALSFGALVSVPLENDCQVYGLIYNIQIDDDGLVRQLVASNNLAENIIADNRQNRNIPMELGVLSVGYAERGSIYHLLPPHPPLSLESITLCDEPELRVFTSKGWGYFRHILRATELPIGELLAAHLKQAHSAHWAAGNTAWINEAIRELIILLRDDYPTLMTVLSALSDALPGDRYE